MQNITTRKQARDAELAPLIARTSQKVAIVRPADRSLQFLRIYKLRAAKQPEVVYASEAIPTDGWTIVEQPASTALRTLMQSNLPESNSMFDLRTCLLPTKWAAVHPSGLVYHIVAIRSTIVGVRQMSLPKILPTTSVALASITMPRPFSYMVICSIYRTVSVWHSCYAG